MAGTDLSREEYLESEKLRLVCDKDHESRPLLVRRVNANGVVIPGFCCTTCGAWKAVKKALAPPVEALPEYDGSARDRYWKARGEKYEAERQRDERDRWDEYSAYLATQKWAVKRAAVLERDAHLCQACRSRKATQAHHLTYAHIYDEPLFDLVAVCEPCHERITKMDRERRARPATTEEAQ